LREGTIFSDNIIYSSIVGKSFTLADISTIFGYKKGATATFSDSTLTIRYDSDIVQIPYTITNGTIRLDSSDGVEGSVEYIKILGITTDEIITCQSNETLEDADNCSNIELAFLSSLDVDTYISQKNRMLPLVLQNKTKITTLLELTDRILYQLGGYHGASGNIDYLSQSALLIDYVHNVRLFWYWDTDISLNIADHPEVGDYHYSASYKNNALVISGIDADGERVYKKNEVYKYALSGYTLTATNLSEAFVSEEILNVLDVNQSFVFNSGNLYCHLFGEVCWVDEDAMNTIKSQLPFRSRVNP